MSAITRDLERGLEPRRIDAVFTLIRRWYWLEPLRAEDRRSQDGDFEARWRRVLFTDPCTYCGGTVDTLDHIIARARGGGNYWANYTGACKPCNQEKDNRGLVVFLLEREKERKQRRRLAKLERETPRLLGLFASKLAAALWTGGNGVSTTPDDLGLSPAGLAEQQAAQAEIVPQAGAPCVATQLCAGPRCDRPARRGKEWGLYCSDHCRFAAWARDNPRQRKLNLEPPKAPRTSALRAFHPRSHITAAEALTGEKRALTQDQAVLAWMRAHPGRWTPPEVLAGLETRAPLTSIRRALTNLTQRGLLKHWPADRRPGVYGSLNSTWETA